MLNPALAPEEYVYRGVWRNRDRGDYLGLTLTVDVQTARILSPALALLITTTGFSVWKLCRYGLHQMRAKVGSHSVLYHQIQIILRNSCTDLDVVYKLLLLASAWRNRKGVRSFRSILAPFSVALSHFALFATFGILSSWALQASDRVLIRSPWCGTWNSTYYNQVFSLNRTNLASVALANEYTSYVNSRYLLAQQNAVFCHDDLQSCSMPKIKSLNWTSRFIPDTCPAINASLCHPRVGGSLQFDTGYLSSHADLGYNAKKEDRVKFRMIAQCAPLITNGFVTDWQDIPAVNDLPAQQVVTANYGRTKLTNSTAMRTKRTIDCGERKRMQPYTVVTHVTEPHGSVDAKTATFDAVPGLMPNDRDLSLILLSFDNAYDGPVKDPWFSAERPLNVSQSFCFTQNNTVYTREREITALACTQQWQICDNKGETCTDFNGISQVKKTLLSMTSQGQFNDLQSATGLRIFRTGITSTFFYVIQALSQAGSPPLKAKSSISYQTQPALPVDQWQAEANYWMSLVMEWFQQANLDYSSGQFAASTAYINVTKPLSGKAPTEKAQDAAYSLCQNQVIYSRNYSNYNFIALVVIVALCIILIILGYSIEWFTSTNRERSLNYTAGNGKQAMWDANTDLDMFQRLDEFRNGTTWTRAGNGVPVTHSSHKIDIKDLVPHELEVEHGSGVVLPAVQRQRVREKGIMSTTTLNKSVTCITCEAISSQPSESDLTKSLSPTQHNGVVGTVGSGDITSNPRFEFRSGFHRDFRYDPLPKSGGTEQHFGRIC